MADLNDQSGGGEPASEVVDALAGESENPNPETDNQGEADANEGEIDPNADPEAGFEEIDFEGERFKVPPKLRDGLLRQADYTKKTQEVAEIRKAAEAEREQVRQVQVRQLEFAGDIAKFGALEDKLLPYLKVQDWGAHIRQHGAQGQADYADYQSIKADRDQFAQSLGAKVQQRQAEEQRETAKLIEDSRVELAKHIKGYSTETVSKLVPVGERFGFSSEEIRQAESDPRSIRVLHRLMELEDALSKQKTASTIAQGQATKPVPTIRGSGGRFASVPERMGPAEMAKHLGYR